jgi:adenine-specific DNA-methyltransferase
MTAVFIGGSLAISRLNPAVREKLDGLIAKNCHILVGDANGADKAVQEHFATRGYQNVTVFCMETCRNNAGGWPTRRIEGGTAKRGFSYYAMKDIAMSREAKYGVMLWDGKSKGTLHNIRNLVGAGKATLVYFATTKEMVKIASGEDLQDLLGRCNKELLQLAESRIAGLPPLGQQRLPIP